MGPAVRLHAIRELICAAADLTDQDPLQPKTHYSRRPAAATSREKHVAPLKSEESQNGSQIIEGEHRWAFPLEVDKSTDALVISPSNRGPHMATKNGESPNCAQLLT